jgi:hypothetical protein
MMKSSQIAVGTNDKLSQPRGRTEYFFKPHVTSTMVSRSLPTNINIYFLIIMNLNVTTKLITIYIFKDIFYRNVHT